LITIKATNREKIGRVGKDCKTGNLRLKRLILREFAGLRRRGIERVIRELIRI
jgi:hypothetical protein